MIKQLLNIIVLFGMATLASASDMNSLIQVDAKAKGSSDYGKNGARTQERKLEIKLSKAASSKIESASIKWIIYGRNMKNRQLVEIESGEMTQDMKDSLAQIVETPTVKMQGQRETKVSSRARGRGRGNRIQVKTIPASGNQYYGFAVMVYDGGKLVASKYSQPSIAKLHAE